jgi:DNA-binding NarL/FixJ family response regulator
LIQKNKELTTDAMILAQNKELNKKILLDIKSLVGCDKAFIESKLSALISELSSINQSTHWDEFQKRFEEVHQDFYRLLINQFPDLSPAELKLASFLKLGLSSKDIASITQNTNESIQVARSRLRKKLNLDSNINLSTYLNSL